MLGAIIGDIVGSRFEFNPTNDYLFDPLFHPSCQFTDDTICTIAVADAILNNRSYKDAVHDWCRRYKGPKGGFGGMFLQWVMSDDPQPYNSFGNGSAMRVSPIAWLFDTEEKVLNEAEKSAIISHDHPLGIEGAQAIALAIFLCHQGLSKETAVRIVCDRFGYDMDINYDDVRNIFDETCPGTVPVALRIILDSTSFEDAIRRAVSLGADADTLGAIVGSIAEAIWGVPDWMEDAALAYLPDDMKEIYKQFKNAKNHE